MHTQVVRVPVVLMFTLVQGTLMIRDKSRLVSSVSGTFGGEWGKNITIKSGTVNGLFNVSEGYSVAVQHEAQTM